MKRQAMSVTIEELRKLIDELEEQWHDTTTIPFSDKIKFQINIINKDKLPDGEYSSDGWRIEK